MLRIAQFGSVDCQAFKHVLLCHYNLGSRWTYYMS